MQGEFRDITRRKKTIQEMRKRRGRAVLLIGSSSSVVMRKTNEAMRK
jgi:hypothetical protein